MRYPSINRLLACLAPCVAACALNVQSQNIQVIGYTNTAWTYNDSSTDANNPGTAWKEVGYVPVIGNGVNQWKTNGHGLFGNDTSTVYTNDFGMAGNGFTTPLDRSNGRITFYFITKFNWPSAPSGVVLRGTNFLDDGAIVYLNGVEVFRSRIPGTPGTPPAWSQVGDNQANEGIPEPLEYAATSLVTGTNTLAVEVHQTSTTSSDVAFATALRAVVPAPPTNTTPAEPIDRAVIQNRSTTLMVIADGQPRPTYQWYKDGVAILGATTNKYTIPLMQSSDAGLYKVILNNEFGSATSRVATVSYIADVNPPVVVRSFGSPTFDHITIEFDELLDQMSAEDSFGYAVSGGVTITAAHLNPNGNSVTLDTSVQAEDTVYTVDVISPMDRAGLQIASGTTTQFRSWVSSTCSGILFESFLGIGAGNAVSDLTSHPNFPNNPSEVHHLTRFDTREAYPDDSHEGYGGRLRGAFVPPLSGNYVFYLRGDDGTALYLNPTGPSSAGKQLIQSLAGCCATFAANQSVPLALTGGQAYYIEALYKEGGGGDYCQVAARLAGSALPPDTESIPSNQLGIPAIPSGALGLVTISQQPTNQSVQEHTPTVTFSVTAANANSAPICYQWQRSDGNGPFADIAGATLSSVSVNFPTIANDNGDRYRVVVSVAGSITTSAAATLTVTPDTVKPTVTAVVATSTTSILVYFSESVDPVTISPLSFAVNSGVSVVGAVQNVNPFRVDLAVTPMTLGNPYQVTIFGPASASGGAGIKDPSGNPLNPDPTIVNIYAQNYSGNPDTLSALPTNGCLPIGCLTARGINGKTYQVSAVIANDNTTAESILTGALGPNIAPAGAQSFLETGVINYNKTIPGADVGHIPGDVMFPGYPPNPTDATAGYENMVIEALCYVELKAGIHRWIVASDDGFRLSSGHTAGGPMIGEFSGGRGVSDTVMDFIVQKDCLYPIRLMWEQGQGGANLEWEKEDLNNPGTYVAINADATIKAFSVSGSKLGIQKLSPGNVRLTWSICNAQLQSATEVAGPWVTIAGATSPYDTTTAGPRRFFKLSPAP